MARVVLQEDIANDNLRASPRIRVNRTASMTLTTSWQDIDFTGTSTFNLNTYPDMTGGKSVTWDAANKKFAFRSPEDRNYELTFYFAFAGGLRPVDIYLRFAIPAPTPIYFPFPDTRGYINIATLERITDYGSEYNTTIYANAAMRQYGLKLQLKSGFTLLTQPNLTEAAVVIYGR